MTDAIVHIGLAKTGTTSLQAWLASNLSYLHSRGIAPLLSLSSHRLAAECIVDPLTRSREDIVSIKKTHPLAECIKEIESHQQHFHSGALILSSEYFSISSPELVAELFHHLVIAPIKIIVYLRRQDLYVSSGYSQDVKALRQSLPFNKLGEAAYTRNLYWDVLIEEWQRSFSGACVNARNYDKLREGSALLADFKNLIGCPEGSALTAPARENLSLDSERTEVARLLNERGRPINLQYLMNLQANNPKPPFGLSRVATETLERQYRQSNEALSQAFPGEFEDWLTAGWLPRGVDMTGTITEERLAAILSRATNGADS